MSEPFLVWDTYEITKNQAEYLANEEGIPKEKAFDLACKDSDLITNEWDNLIECLTGKIQEINPSGSWRAKVENFGWRSLNGEKRFFAENGQEFLNQILPKTDCTFKIFVEGTEISIQNFHHDSPYGNEWYYIEEDKVKDHYEKEECPDCGEPIPNDAVEGGQCENCEHVWSY